MAFWGPNTYGKGSGFVRFIRGYLSAVEDTIKRWKAREGSFPSRDTYRADLWVLCLLRSRAQWFLQRDLN